MTQAELFTLQNKYFIRADGTDWPISTLSTAAANAAVGGIQTRVGSLSAQYVDDLILMIDALVV